MNQSQIDHAVASATGETVTTVKSLGFSIWSRATSFPQRNPSSHNTTDDADLGGEENIDMNLLLPNQPTTWRHELTETIRIRRSVTKRGRQHHSSTLFPQSEAIVSRCAAKSTIYMAKVAAGLMLHQFAR